MACWTHCVVPLNSVSDYSPFLPLSQSCWEGKRRSGKWKFFVNYQSCVHLGCCRHRHLCGCALRNLCERGLGEYAKACRPCAGLGQRWSTVFNEEGWRETRRHVVACGASGHRASPALGTCSQTILDSCLCLLSSWFPHGVWSRGGLQKEALFLSRLLGTIRKGSRIQIPNWNSRLSP